VESAKRERLLALCRERGADGVWIRRRANVAWAADGADVHCDLSSELGVASILWTPERCTLRTDTIEAQRLTAEEPFAGCEVRAVDWWQRTEPPAGRWLCDWPDDVLQPLRAPLTDAEIARVRALGRDAAECLEGALRGVRRGDSEHEVAASIAGALRRRGVHAIVLLVAADGRIARFRHPIPTAARVERVLMAAICAQRYGLIVSATRLVHFGPVGADLRRRHDAVCAVDTALHDATRPGACWCDLLQRAIDTYSARGYPDAWREHHQGGPMGYAARDFKATPDERRVVLERQLVGWNPSIAGTKSEDTILSDGEVVTRGDGAWPLCGSRPDILVLS
jgi:Xaa-Pro aminopeptidase